MVELLFIGILALLIIGFYQDRVWRENAKRDMRIYSRGKLYWVIEDGDTEKLNHVTYCFKTDAMMKAREEK